MRRTDERMQRACTNLRDGRIDGNEFVRETKSEWEKIGASLIRRWKTPSWFEVRDVVQELVLAAIDLVWKFEDGRGSSIGKFVVWNSIVEAKYAIHVARGVNLHDSPDRARSRAELPFSHLYVRADATDGSDHLIERLLAAAGFGDFSDQESAVAMSERVADALRACDTLPEMVAIRTLSEVGSMEVAATAIWRDPQLRRRARVRSEEDAARLVARTTIEVANRLEENAA